MNFTSGITYVGSARDPDVVYYSASIINNNTAAGNEDDPIVQFKETKDSPIISDTSQYECVVTKVTMEGAQKNFPVFIPQIELVKQTDASGVSYVTLPDVNKSVYTMTFGVVYDISGQATPRLYANTQNVVWFPENVSTPAPTPQTTAPSPVGNTRSVQNARQVFSDYYYTYSYNHWLICVNNALKTAWSNVKAQVATDLSGINGGALFDMVTRCPKFEYDEVTKLFSVYTDAATSVTPGNIDLSGATITGNETSFIGYNTNFEGLFTNFDTQYYGAAFDYDETLPVAHPSPPLPSPLLPGPTSDTTYPENLMVTRNKAGTNIQLAIDPTTGVGYDAAPTSTELLYISYVTTMDFNATGSLWSPIAEIVLTTQNIPVRNEYVSAPIRGGVGNLGVLPASASQFQTLLTSYTMDSAQTSDDFRGYLKYEPNLHKVIQMAPSKDELKTIDIQFWWRYRWTNELIPLRIYNLGSVNVQLMFRRKGQDA
jgi:hypothetical protein